MPDVTYIPTHRERESTATDWMNLLRQTMQDLQTKRKQDFNDMTKSVLMYAESSGLGPDEILSANPEITRKWLDLAGFKKPAIEQFMGYMQEHPVTAKQQVREFLRMFTESPKATPERTTPSGVTEQPSVGIPQQVQQQVPKQSMTPSAPSAPTQTPEQAMQTIPSTNFVVQVPQQISDPFAPPQGLAYENKTFPFQSETDAERFLNTLVHEGYQGVTLQRDSGATQTTQRQVPVQQATQTPQSQQTPAVKQDTQKRQTKYVLQFEGINRHSGEHEVINVNAEDEAAVENLRKEYEKQGYKFMGKIPEEAFSRSRKTSFNLGPAVPIASPMTDVGDPGVQEAVKQQKLQEMFKNQALDEHLSQNAKVGLQKTATVTQELSKELKTDEAWTPKKAHDVIKKTNELEGALNRTLNKREFSKLLSTEEGRKFFVDSMREKLADRSFWSAMTALDPAYLPAAQALSSMSDPMLLKIAELEAQAKMAQATATMVKAGYSVEEAKIMLEIAKLNLNKALLPDEKQLYETYREALKTVQDESEKLKGNPKALQNSPAYVAAAKILDTLGKQLNLPGSAKIVEEPGLAGNVMKFFEWLTGSVRIKTGEETVKPGEGLSPKGQELLKKHLGK